MCAVLFYFRLYRLLLVFQYVCDTIRCGQVNTTGSLICRRWIVRESEIVLGELYIHLLYINIRIDMSIITLI